MYRTVECLVPMLEHYFITIFFNVAERERDTAIRVVVQAANGGQEVIVILYFVIRENTADPSTAFVGRLHPNGGVVFFYAILQFRTLQNENKTILTGICTRAWKVVLGMTIPVCVTKVGGKVIATGTRACAHLDDHKEWHASGTT